MQLATDKIIEVFYLVDEFCQAFTKSFDAHLIGKVMFYNIVEIDYL